MNINFESYKVFYYVAKYLSFSKASKALFVSQSAVSQSIKQLEEKLNTTLFFRQTKKVSLTKEGELLFDHIEKAFNFIKTGERSLQSVSLVGRGEIKIGASDTICKYYLIPFIDKFHELYPNIKIKIINRPSPVCAELLTKGEVDISIINLPDKLDYKNISYREIKKIQDVFIAGKKYIHLKGKPMKLKDLENFPLLLLEKNSTTRSFFESLIIDHKLNIAPEIELGSIDLLIELTKIGLGFSFVMEDSVLNEIEDEEVFILDIKERTPKRSIGVLTNTEVHLPESAKKFIDILF